MNDRLNDARQTNDMGYILGGTSSSNISGEKTDSSRGGDDFWIVKVDSVGNIEWDKTIGGSGTDDFSKFVLTRDGGYVLGGTSDSPISGEKTDSSKGGKDYWIVKINSVGTIQWQKTFGGSSTDELSGIAQTPDGGYFIGGTSTSGISGDKSETNSGLNDYWVIRIDSIGNLLWENTIGGSAADALRDIQLTNDGGYILSGHSSSDISGDKTSANIGSADYWIVKLDSVGNIQWQSAIGGTGIDNARTIVATSDGGFLVGGNSTSPISGNKTVYNFSGADLWPVKLDASGNIQWQKNIGMTSADFFQGLIETSNHEYLISSWGNSGIAGDKTVRGEGTKAYWAILLDSLGNTLWQYTVGGLGEDYLQCSQEVKPSQYLLAGYSNSNIGGHKTEDCRGLFDYWIIHVSNIYNSIQGISFLDLNSNGVMDSMDVPIANHPHFELNTGRMAISQQDGTYSVNIPDTGSFSVFPDSLQHFIANPSQRSVQFIGLPEVDTLNDFAFQPVGVINDLRIVVTPFGPFRPGFRAYYSIHYKNIGTTVLSPSIIFRPDTGISYDSATVIPDLVTTDSILWNISSLSPMEEGSIFLTIRIDSTVVIGSTVNAVAEIEPIVGDTVPDDNQSITLTTVRGSFDPNDILVNRTSITTAELSPPLDLIYTIRFQNTGTDTAFNVSINNPISAYLNPTSFELLESSHPSLVTYDNTNRTFWFDFDNILLPDSNIDQEKSNGFIKYRIKPYSSLVPGNTIRNEAFIYFDFNPAVATNAVFTTISIPTNIISPQNKRNLIIYPNPVLDRANISLLAEEQGVATIQIYNSLGELVGSFENYLTIGRQEVSFSLNKLPRGFYIIRLTTGSGSFSGQLVKH